MQMINLAGTVSIFVADKDRAKVFYTPQCLSLTTPTRFPPGS